MIPGWLNALGLLAACGLAQASGVEATDIKPRVGLTLTNTVFANVVVSNGAAGAMDTEDFFTLKTVAPEGLTYQIKMSTPGSQKVQEVAARLQWPRTVRHEDLEESARMTVLYASTDPESYGGQTFAETSKKVLATLKAGGETPFVFGPYAVAQGDVGTLAALSQSASAKPTASPPPAGGPPIPDMGAVFQMMFGSARHYYRGTLHRVEPRDVPIAVLVNGVDSNLPAVHAAGDFTFGQDNPVKIEVWWLDNPDWPLTLRWSFGRGSSLVTRIDWQETDTNDMAQKLQGTSCRVELHGIYFNSGSAILLEESEPMLKQVAALIKASSDATLTIEGHTDNIGSAGYNQTLSEQRASAVRDALVTRYGIAAGRLSAKGYGLTQPVGDNATVEGRAHNRRVELARLCAH